jgi:hypothetical protein
MVKKNYFCLQFLNMKQSGFLLLLVFSMAISYSQKGVSYNLENGIDNVENQYISVWKKIKKMDGFRIQITSFSGVNSKSSIEKTATQFKQQFPNVPCNVSFFEPYFRLRAGNYRTKLEAYKALTEISPSFPGSFVVKDQIDFK